MKNTVAIIGAACLGLGIVMYFYVSHAPVPYGLNQRTFAKYHTLLYEQIIALKGERPKDKTVRKIWDRYNLNFTEAQQFAEQVKKYMDQYPDIFPPRDAEAITRKLKSARPSIKNDHEKLLDIGTPVFHNFHGRWRGIWRQAGKDQIFDQTWFPPEELKKRNLGIIVQPVTLGPWDEIKKKRTKLKVAINGYNKNTGVILGAVGVKGNRSTATYAGYYLGQNKLVWVARFKDEKSEHPYYSVYYERIIEGEPTVYQIDGVGFHWNRKTNRIKRPHLKYGKYQKLKRLE